MAVVDQQAMAALKQGAQVDAAVDFTTQAAQFMSNVATASKRQPAARRSLSSSMADDPRLYSDVLERVRGGASTQDTVKYMAGQGVSGRGVPAWVHNQMRMQGAVQQLPTTINMPTQPPLPTTVAQPAPRPLLGPAFQPPTQPPLRPLLGPAFQPSNQSQAAAIRPGSTNAPPGQVAGDDGGKLDRILQAIIAGNRLLDQIRTKTGASGVPGPGGPMDLTGVSFGAKPEDRSLLLGGIKPREQEPSGFRRMTGGAADRLDRLNELGGLTRLGGSLGMTAHLAQAGMSTATGMVNIAKNVDIAGGQKRELMAEQIPIIGGLIKSFREFRHAVDGTTERLRQLNIVGTMLRTSQEAQFRTVTAVDARQREVDAAQRTADQMRRLQPTQAAEFDRTYVQGQIQHREEQLRLPARQQVAEAEARQAAARENVQGLQRRVTGLRGNVAETGGGLQSLLERSGVSQAQRARFMQAMQGGGTVDRARELTGVTAEVTANAPNQAEAVRRLESLRLMTNEFAQAQSRLATETQNVSRAEQDQARSESEVRQARIASQRAEMEILAQRAQNQQANAGRVGGMNVLERQQGLQAIRMLEERGPDAVPPELIRAAMAFDPRAAQAVMQRGGEQSEEYRARQQDLGQQVQGENRFMEQRGGFEAGTIRETQQQMAQLQTQIQVAVNVDHQELADRIAAALNTGFREMIQSLNADAMRQLAELRWQIAQQNNQQ